MAVKKIEEVRPEVCGTRIGDIVEMEGKRFLQVKCRRCTKMDNDGQEHYHYIRLSDGDLPATS